MTVQPTQTVDDIWTWLKACQECGKVHEWRWTCDLDHVHGGRPNGGFLTCKGGTWAALDGHVYEHRIFTFANLDILQREYEATHRS